MSKFQWLAGDETLGGAPALLQSVGQGALTDWEVVAEPSCARGQALKLTGIAEPFRRLVIAGAVGATLQRIDVRYRVYRVSNLFNQVEAILLHKGTGFSTDYSASLSTSTIALRKYKAGTATAITSTPVTPIFGWWRVRFTYWPSGSPRLQIKAWHDDTGTEADAFVVNQALIDSEINGTQIGFGTSSVAQLGTMIDWMTVGVGGDDADTYPDLTIWLEGAAHAGAAASGDLSTTIPLEGAALATALAAGTLTTEIPLAGAAHAGALAHGVLSGGSPVVPPLSRTLSVERETRMIPV